MEIITSHTGTDFDSLAAMVAAKRLYPLAELVFSGSQEKNVREYLAQEFENLHSFKKIRHLSLEKITRLILVDTRQPGRIGTLADCLNNPGIAVHIYDHHPATENDIKGEVEHIEPCGSTTTIMTRLLREQDIMLDPKESTLLALGIYEDTGGFLYSSTTQEDLQAAAWLLGQGANLDVVSQFFFRELTAKQISLIGQLQENSRMYMIRGIHTVITRLALDEYIDDFAVLVQRSMSADNLDALFAFIEMRGRIHLICRSRIPEINAGTIAREFGGGGHASAASATITDLTLFQAEENLLALLHSHIRPRAIAGEIMSTPVISLTPEVTISQAARIMTRYNVTVLPVVRLAGSPDGSLPPSGLLGVISRMVVEKGIFHELGHVPVAEYMTSGIAALTEEATLADIQKVMVENRQRLIPVLHDESVVGVITRTDLMGLIVNDPGNVSPDLLSEDEYPSVKRRRNLSSLMTQMLPREIIILLREIGETAKRLHCQAFVAGGFVRDLLLRHKNMDIDIVIEGSGIVFANALADERGGTVHPHEKFGTATVVLPDRMRIDVATARLEYYEHPAALPTVELGSIKLDLFRRDFTINAMAIHLNPERFGTLVDYFNSQNDLRERRIQVLHNLSFVEDPTRIFRAIRFESRLDFQITRHSEKLIKNAVSLNLPERIEDKRFLHELQLILSEDDPAPALRRMEDLQLFPFLWPDLQPDFKIDRRFLHVLTLARQAISWFRLLYLEDNLEQWLVYVLAIMSRYRIKDLDNFCQRFEMPEKQWQLLVQQKQRAEKIAQELLKRPYARPSEIYWLLAELSNEGLLYLMAIARKRYIQKAVSLYVTHLRSVRPLIGGESLKAMGYRPGPQFGTMLKHLIEVQLDGEVQTVTQAEDFIRSQYPPPVSEKSARS
ncbi:MAG: CBS domain-containing protein [Desulfobulbaceae bacterium]|nr:CBS domain-containing protein [Desulfobulbaceae bacterium]